MAFPDLTWNVQMVGLDVDWIWNGVVWIEELSLYIAVGYAFSTDEGVIAVSPTGETWTIYQPDEVKAHQWYDAAYHAGTDRLVVVGGYYSASPDPTDKCITSVDSGVTWTAHDIVADDHGAADSTDWGGVVALPSGRSVAGAVATYSEDHEFAAYSDDGGSTWTGVTAPSPYGPGGGSPSGSVWGRLAAKTDGSRIVLPNNQADEGVPYSDDEGETWTTGGTLPASAGSSYGAAAAWSPTLSLFAIDGREQFQDSSAWTGNGASSWTNRFRSDGLAISADISQEIAWIAAASPFFLALGGPTLSPPDDFWLRSSDDGSTWFDGPTNVGPETSFGSTWTSAAYSPSVARIAMVSVDGDIVTADLAAPVEELPDRSGTGPAGGFTAGFEDFLATGNGALSYRLMIEGWPEEFVTDARITHEDGRDGRTVYTGLCRQGMRIGDRVIMQDAKTSASGNAFRVVPEDSFERSLQSFSNFPAPIARLDGAIDEDDVAITLFGGGALTSGSYYHLGTEAILAGDAGAVTRHIWDTLSQSHHTSLHDETRNVFIYDRPPTMEGRRAYLFAYGELDDGAGDGSLVWRGIVNRPPRVDRDGLSWVIDVGPITDVLKQQMSGDAEDAHPFGIYHHAQSALGIQVTYNDQFSGIRYYTGIDNDESTLIANVNEILEDIRGDMGITEIPAGGITLDHRIGEPWTINVAPDDDFTGSNIFEVSIGSPIIGFVIASGVTSTWVNQSAANLTAGQRNPVLLEGGEKYFAALKREVGTGSWLASFGWEDAVLGFNYDEPPVSPLGAANNLTHPILATADRGKNFFHDPSMRDTWPRDRIYIDRDTTGWETVYISDTLSPSGTYQVTDQGQDGSGRFYIAVELYMNVVPPVGQTKEDHEKALIAQAGFDGFLTGSTTINPVHIYVSSGSVIDFVAALKDAAIDANDGETAQITPADLSTWEFGDAVNSPLQLHRSYWFIKPHSLEDILAEECKFVLHCPRIGLSGLVELLPLPQYTDAAIVDDLYVLDTTSIVTPHEGMGAWPGWAPQRDGLVLMVDIKENYDFRTDDWKDQRPPFQDPDAIATHKGRGKSSVLTIALYSAPADLSVPPDENLFREIATAYLSQFSTDYAVVEFEVPFTKFKIRCLDTVIITHALVPNGDGTRGMELRAGVVIEHAWPGMDPANVGAPGRLTVLVNLTPIAGYSPSVAIDEQTDNGGDNWTIHALALGDQLNVDWSSGADGEVLARFHDGDFVQVVQWDDASPTIVTGVVVGEPDLDADTIVVQFDGTWTPGADDWLLEYQPDPDAAHATDVQRKYAYTATSAMLVPNATPLRSTS